MLKQILKLIFCSLIFFNFLAVPVAYGQALQDARSQLEITADEANLTGGETNIARVVGNVINVLLGLIGTFFLAVIVYAGFVWMTAGGDTEKVQRAISLIRNSIIGLIIILGSFIITSFIIDQITTNVV